MLVSVIIPCYNVEEYIEDCLASVVSQKYEHLEVIAVDNQSTDNTLQKLRNFKRNRMPELNILEQRRKGASCARNKGLKKASGKWIQFLDADDMLLPDKISSQVKLIQRHADPNTSFIAGSSIKLYATDKNPTLSLPEKNKYLSPFINSYGNTCANLWSASWLNEVGGWNENLKSSQETDLMFRLILTDSDTLLDETPNCIVRERESGQISQGPKKPKWQTFIRVRIEYLKKIKSLKPKIYKQFEIKFKTYLVSSLFILSNYDVTSAATLYSEIFDNSRIVKSGYGVRNFHSLAILLFGFKWTVFLRNYLIKLSN